ncbi:MAG: hypothetical protein FWH08_00730 [Oscillospiraceae bacterium]|nr:hypothetical protein [Oscillospiraceae bacterium]
MDSFVEQMIAKKSETKDKLKRLGLVFGGSVLCFVFLTAARLFPFASMLLIFLGIGVIWLTWIMIQNTFIEYEYIITNDELDIDKIMAKKKRKRLITIKINKTEEWGEYSDGKTIDVTVTVEAHDCGYKNLWYIVTRHEKYGKTALLFSPNRNVLSAINKSVPYSLRKKELKEDNSDA